MDTTIDTRDDALRTTEVKTGTPTMPAREYIVLGALAAGLGGRVGTPREMVGVTADSTRAFPRRR